MTATPRTAAGRALLLRIIGPDEPVHDYTSAILAIEAEAREALDVADDDFRDRHERALRDHILGGPESHVCDDLCSDAIVDRLVGRNPSNEYPPKPAYGGQPRSDEALRAALTLMVDVFADGIGMHSVNAGFCSLTQEGHEAIEQARAAIAAAYEGEGQ